MARQQRLPWFYKGRNVWYPDWADIPKVFFYQERLHDLVQHILDQTPAWGKGDRPIEEMEFGERDSMAQLSVDIEPDEEIIWAIHVGHSAKKPRLSPFVHREHHPLTKKLAIELGGSAERPVIGRITPGGYKPALPWQSSATNSVDKDGNVVGRRLSRQFWRNHAYLYRPSRTVPGSETDQPPTWWTEGMQQQVA